MLTRVQALTFCSIHLGFQRPSLHQIRTRGCHIAYVQLRAVGNCVSTLLLCMHLLYPLGPAVFDPYPTSASLSSAMRMNRPLRACLK